MATIFVFRMPEDELRKALATMERKRYEEMTGAHFALEVSVELIPDGIGYEATNLQVNIIEEKATNATTTGPELT